MIPPAIPPIEWDEAKRQRTLAERGVDFAAFAVFWDGRPFEDRQDLRHTAEAQFVTYGPKIPLVRQIGEPRRIGDVMDKLTYDPATFDWTKFDATTDEDIARQIAEDPDTAPDLVEAEEKGWLVPVESPPPPVVGIRPDVLAWFQAQGPGYTARINAVLEAHMRDAAGRG